MVNLSPNLIHELRNEADLFSTSVTVAFQNAMAFSSSSSESLVSHHEGVMLGVSGALSGGGVSKVDFLAGGGVSITGILVGATVMASATGELSWPEMVPPSWETGTQAAHL